MNPEQTVRLLKELNEHRFRNRVSTTAYAVGAWLLGDDEGRIDYAVLAGMFHIQGATEKATKKSIQRIVSELESVGFARREKVKNEWTISLISSGHETAKKDAVFTGQNRAAQVDNQVDAQVDKKNTVEPVTPVNDSQISNKQVDISVDNQVDAQVDTIIQIQDSSKEESNQIQLPMTTKAPLTEVKGAGGVPLSAEMLSAVERVYKRRNENFKLLSGRMGSNAAVTGNKLVPDAQSVQKYLKALVKSGVSAFGFQKEWGPMGLEGAVECLCAVLDIIAKNDHFKRHYNYYNFATIFNTEFPKRLGWLIDSGWTPGMRNTDKPTKSGDRKHGNQSECEFRPF